MAGRASSLDRNRSNRFCRSDRREFGGCREVNATNLRIKQALLQDEYDELIWKKERTDKRLDSLVREIEDTEIDLGIAEIIETAHTLPEVVAQAPIKRMEIL